MGTDEERGTPTERPGGSGRRHRSGPDARAVVATVLAAVAAAPGTASAQEADAGHVLPIALPEPTGPWAIGVRTHLVRDTTRTAPRGEAAARPVLLRIWYPAVPADRTPRPYMDSVTARHWRETLPVPPGFEERVATHAVPDAPVAAERQRWPVLLFSHGRSWPVENYQAILEELASRGWVVAAISHPGHAIVVLPDGRELPFDRPGWETEEERGRVLMEDVSDGVADARAALDALEALASDPSDLFGRRLDLEAGVGMAGHSYGGAVAVWTLQEDRRVRAAASLEGQVYDPELRPLAVDGPLLHMIGGYNRSEIAGLHYRPAPGGGPVYEVIVHGLWHASFSDLILLYRPYAPPDWHQRHRYELRPERGLRIVTDHLHEFFAQALLGERADLLRPRSDDELGSPATSGYPEVELRVFAR